MFMPAPQRIPAKERKISGIGPHDSRVSIVGTVVDSGENVMVVDDGTGKIDIVFESPVQVRSGQRVRVVGKVMQAEDGPQMQGEAVQEFPEADLELWRRVGELWEKSLKQL
jgi:RNase P/RNase MRP subunit p29